jgi:hypothetical protein
LIPTSNISPAHDLGTHRFLWIWGLIILATFSLFRLPGLGVTLASDELATVSLWAQMPYSEIISNYQYPNNHIFLTLILSFLLKTFGLKEWLLRMPVMICGLASLYLSYKLGKKISGQSAVGIFTAFLMAVSEKHIFFSTNARGYIVITVLTLIAVTFLLNQLEAKPINRPSILNGVLVFLGWICIWVMGTWTIPTFLFFEVSIAIFIIGLMLSGNRLLQIHKQPLAIALASVITGAAGFYFQYYVLIDEGMLAAASSNVSTTSFSDFLPGLLAVWVDPFAPAGILLLLLALIGLRRLFQQNLIAGILITCVWLGPITIAIFGFLFGKLPTIPYPRTFFYLQPFFLMLGVMGAKEFGAWISKIMKWNSDSLEKGMRVLAILLAGGLFFISGLKFFQHTYPQRMSREPFDRVKDFTQKLNPNDLLLVSNKLHVGFLLYGAIEMRNRVENILRDGKIESIYFLDYEKKEVFENQDIEKNKIFHPNFPRMVGNTGQEGPAIFEKAVEKIAQFGPFIFYRLKSKWLRPNPSWENAGLNPSSVKTNSYKWEKIPSSSGIRPLIRFEDSFTVAILNKEPLYSKPSGLTINLVEVSGNDKSFSVGLLTGHMKKSDIVYDPGWFANVWTLNHPYGTHIFNHFWNPAIFISQGEANLSALDVKFFQHPGFGALKNFLSYRIQEPRAEEK